MNHSNLVFTKKRQSKSSHSGSDSIQFYKIFDIIFFVRNLEPVNSSSKAIMDDANRLVEYWCEIGEFVMVKVSPICSIIPRAIISYAIYFATNARDEAFELPFLCW